MIAQWIKFSVVTGKVAATFPTLSAKTTDEGWFAFCGLPTEAMVSFLAIAGADSSGVVTFDVPARTAVHHDFYVGQAELISSAPVDSATVPDSLRRPTETFRRGPVRVRGIVRDAAQHAPFPAFNSASLEPD